MQTKRFYTISYRKKKVSRRYQINTLYFCTQRPSASAIFRSLISSYTLYKSRWLSRIECQAVWRQTLSHAIDIDPRVCQISDFCSYRARHPAVIQIIQIRWTQEADRPTAYPIENPRRRSRLSRERTNSTRRKFLEARKWSRPRLWPLARSILPWHATS